VKHLLFSTCYTVVTVISIDCKMSFRGRSFRPRAFTRPPTSGRGGPPPGIRGNFRFQGPASYVGRPTSSSHDDYPSSELTSFEQRDRFRRARSPDEEVGILYFSDIN